MRQLQNYKLGREWLPDNYGESLYLEKGDLRIPLSAGLSDSVSIYADKESIYVVAENNQLDYIGLEVFNRQTGEKEGEFFDQSNECGYLEMQRYSSKILAMLEHIN
jgi:hypothetical protein